MAQFPNDHMWCSHGPILCQQDIYVFLKLYFMNNRKTNIYTCPIPYPNTVETAVTRQHLAMKQGLGYITMGVGKDILIF